MEYNPSPYVTWIKHLSDYRSDSDVLVEKDGGLEILVHPSHKPLFVPHTGSLYEVIDKEDKTVQLYFYSLAWIIPILTQSDEEKISAALGLVENIVDIAPEEERSGAWNMLWDDHAVCERLCVIIELLSNTQLFVSINKDKLERHLGKTYIFIEELVASDRWLNNNHRLFHFLASFVYHHYKNDSEKVEEFVGHISGFCHDLIDAETGFAREQCISYCFFDINVVEKVVNTVSGLSTYIGFDVDEIYEKLLHHVNAIAFPDDSLPACGDTPYGLKLSSFQKKYAIVDSLLHEHWIRLEKLGYYRGESEGKNVHFLMLSHNGESGHGHYSPLHVDVWLSNFGPILVDCGGPYKYGDKERYNWFRASRGHNAISFGNKDSHEIENINISTGSKRNCVLGFVKYTDGGHGRKFEAHDEGFIINDFVFLEDEWCVYYNFAPGLSLSLSSENNNELILESDKGGLVIIRCSSDDICFNVEMTKRCIGHSKFDYGPTLVLSSSSRVSFYSLRFDVIS